MISSKTPSQTDYTSPQCPRCHSAYVEKCAKTYPGRGVLSKTVCMTCRFWVCNAAFVDSEGEMQYRGFMREGAIPEDLPMVMKEEVVRWD